MKRTVYGEYFPPRPPLLSEELEAGIRQRGGFYEVPDTEFSEYLNVLLRRVVDLMESHVGAMHLHYSDQKVQLYWGIVLEGVGASVVTGRNSSNEECDLILIAISAIPTLHNFSIEF